MNKLKLEYSQNLIIQMNLIVNSICNALFFIFSGKAKYLIISVLLLLAINAAEAKKFVDSAFSSRSAYSLFGNFGANSHVANFKGFPGIPSCCPRYETGSGMGLGIGAMYSFPLIGNFDMQLRAEYENQSAKLLKDEQEILDNGNGGSVAGIFRHTVDSKIVSFGISPLAAFRFGERLRLLGGFSIFSLVKTDFSQKEEILTPDYGVFADNGKRLRHDTSGIIPGAESIGISLKFGASYYFPMNKYSTLFIAPEIFYSMGLTSFGKDLAWKNNSFRAGISINYAPREVIEEIIIPPAPPPFPNFQPAPETPILSINAVTLNPDGVESTVSMLKVEEFLSVQMHPILNFIFFDENSAEIPKRFNKLDANQISNFSINKFFNFSSLDIYHQVLNIVGKRLLDYPNAKILLTGCNSGKESEPEGLKLSESRAVAVRNYFVDVWKIDPGRIEINAIDLPKLPSNKSTKDGLEENRRVEITSNEPEIFKPIIVFDTIRVFNPPHLRYKIQSYCPTGIINWKVGAIQGLNNLRQFDGQGKPPSEIDWDLAKETNKDFIPNTESSLKYNIEIKDTNNVVFTSEGEMKIDKVTVEKKAVQMIEDKKFEKFSLILFDFNQSTLSAENQKIAQIAKESIKTNSKVTIKGYSDRVGDEKHNFELSQKRAQSTAKVLNVGIENAVGLGETQLLYDNETPEGRFYCRTVVIEIVTETK